MQEKKNNDTPENNVWLERLRPVAVLCGICLVASLLLSLTNSITAPVVAENERIAREAERKTMFDEADTFTETDVPQGTEGTVSEIYVAMKGEEVIGYIVSASSQGYGGQVPIVVAFDAEGAIANIGIGSHSETPSLGDRIDEPDFLAQFMGRTEESQELDALSGATVSSKSVLESVNMATNAVVQILGA